MIRERILWSNSQFYICLPELARRRNTSLAAARRYALRRRRAHRTLRKGCHLYVPVDA